jgi:NAD/NADP transhydrogenase alpha subunit
MYLAHDQTEMHSILACWNKSSEQGEKCIGSVEEQRINIMKKNQYYRSKMMEDVKNSLRTCMLVSTVWCTRPHGHTACSSQANVYPR